MPLDDPLMNFLSRKYHAELKLSLYLKHWIVLVTQHKDYNTDARIILNIDKISDTHFIDLLMPILHSYTSCSF